MDKLKCIIQKIFNNQIIRNIHLSKNVTFVLMILLFIFALSQSLCLLMLSMSMKQDVLNYKESGNLDYKVYLKKNDFYESNYLDKDMVYVSSLIDNVNATFNYKFDVDRESNINYDYEVVGEIIIYDNAKENVFFRKEYVLAKNVKDSIKGAKEFAINKNVIINYGYYNSLANKFRQNYGVSSKSDFVVKLKLKYNNDEEVMKISNNKELSLTIPLSENEVNITLNNSKISGNKQVLGKQHLVIDSSRKLVSSVLLALISVFLLVYIIINLFELRINKNKYESYIKKLLREYDRLIVNTSTPPTLYNMKVLTVSSFQELVDVHDNLGIPIMYYDNPEHKKCIFYINHDNEVFTLRLNESDFEK